jgi:hypothetical protein
VRFFIVATLRDRIQETGRDDAGRLSERIEAVTRGRLAPTASADDGDRQSLDIVVAEKLREPIRWSREADPSFPSDFEPFGGILNASEWEA